MVLVSFVLRCVITYQGILGPQVIPNEWSKYTQLKGSFPDETFYAVAGGSDDKFYAFVGWLYVHGVSPDTLNLAHPPLAKYMIGFSQLLFMNPVLLGFMFSVLTIAMVYVICERVVVTSPIAILPSLLLSLDKMYMTFSLISMLDIYVTFFVVASMLLLTNDKEWGRPLLGVTIGLALSCKWTAAFLIVVPPLYYAVKRDLHGLKFYPFCLFIAALTYTATYARFFLVGHSLQDFVNLQLLMSGILQQRHLAIQGVKSLRILLVFLTGVEGPTQIQTLLLNSVNRTVTVAGSGRGLSLMQSYDPLTWPTSFSASVLALYYSIRRDRVMSALPLGFLLLLFSIASIGEPFIWYLLPGLPLAFISLTYMINRMYTESRNKTVAVAILLLYVAAVIIWSFFVNLPPYIEMSKTS